MSAGGLALVANNYCIELADPEVRGMMAMLINLGILLGLFSCGNMDELTIIM